MPDRHPRLPRISPLQFLALGVLRTGESPGRRVREIAHRFGVRSTPAAFYQVMARLERDGLIEGWYAQIHVGDQAVTERRYRITGAGDRVWSRARDFYRDVVASATEGWSNA